MKRKSTGILAGQQDMFEGGRHAGLAAVLVTTTFF